MAEWKIELQAFDLEFVTTKTIKSKAQADFVTEWTDPAMEEPPEGSSTPPDEGAPDIWSVHFDDA